MACILISLGCGIGIFIFLRKTLQLTGTARIKQFIAIVLIFEAVVFLLIYTQMSSTLVLFAQNNSNHNLLGFTISPAQYQSLNPLMIFLIGSQLPLFYRLFPRFIIPYQFASGTILAGIAILIMAFAATRAVNGIIEGNYIALTYSVISIAELWVSAIGLSMIGLYCDHRNIAFAMGVWYLSNSLAYAISGKIAAWVAIPQHIINPIDSLPYYQNYYLIMGISAIAVGLLMLGVAYYVCQWMRQRQIELA